MKKKLLAILLALGLVITCMPMMAAFAATEITENPLKLEKTGEKAYTVSLTLPSTYLEGGVDTVQVGFSFPEKFKLETRNSSPNKFTYKNDDGDETTCSASITPISTANTNHEVVNAFSCGDGNYIQSETGIVLTVNFTTTGAPTENDGEFKITSYLVSKKTSLAADTPVVRTVGYSGADTAAYTLDADRFAVAANSAEGTAEHTHTYGAPTYEWNYDDPENVTCTASRKCETNPNHIETEEATVTSEVTQEATCMQKKETTYTATFENTAFEKQTKVVTGAIDPNNHDYTVTYAWDLSNQSGVTCTATRECKRNEAHDKKIEEAKEIKENIIGKATCTSTGKKTYTASFDSFAPSESEEVEIPATGHDFENSKDYLHDSTQHWKKCKNCDAGEENKKENHTGINKCDICGYEKTYTVTCNVTRYGVRDDVEITGYLCKKDGSYSDKITDDQFRKGDTGLPENEIKEASAVDNKIIFNGVTAGNYVLVILGDETTRSTRVAFVVDGDNISRQEKLYLFGDIDGSGALGEKNVKKFMEVVVGTSEYGEAIQAALGYSVHGRPKAVDITKARRIMDV